MLDEVRHGFRRAEIARRRGTSVDAVKYHLANISGKLGVRGAQLRHWPGIPITSPSCPQEDRPHDHLDRLRLGTIGQVSLSIRDVARSERFYGETLGLPHVFTFGDLAFFDAAGVRLYLHRKDEADWRPSSTLYFLVEEIHAAQEALTSKGVHFTGAPHVIFTDEQRDGGVDDVLRGRRGQHARPHVARRAARLGRRSPGGLKRPTPGD